MECQLLERITSSLKYFIQWDEVTDVSNADLLLAFVRYCADGNIYDDLLFCKKLSIRKTADEVIGCLDNHFTVKGIDWKNCVCVYVPMVPHQ